MPSQKNIKIVKELNEKLNQAKSVVLADYKGLNVSQMTELRQKIKEVGGELKVIKNTLLQLGFEKLEELTGPTAILFSYNDEIAPIKALYEFFEKNDLPKIKIGFFDKELIEKDRIIALAQLPSQAQLHGRLIGVLNSPIYGLIYVLRGNLASLINILKAI